jgi:hypothetical protein
MFDMLSSSHERHEHCLPSGQPLLALTLGDNSTSIAILPYIWMSAESY